MTLAVLLVIVLVHASFSYASLSMCTDADLKEAHWRNVVVALGFASVTFSFRFSRTCSTTTRPSLIRQGIFAEFCKESVCDVCMWGKGEGLERGICF